MSEEKGDPIKYQHQRNCNNPEPIESSNPSQISSKTKNKLTNFGKQLNKITGGKTSDPIQKRLSGKLTDYVIDNPKDTEFKQEITQEKYKMRNGPTDYMMEADNLHLDWMQEMGSFGINPHAVIK